jgi:hypothetical protein
MSGELHSLEADPTNLTSHEKLIINIRTPFYGHRSLDRVLPLGG